MIRYPHIYQAVHCQPWLIVPTAHSAIVEVLHSRLFGDQPQFSAQSVVLEQPVHPVCAGQTTLEGGSRFAQTTVDGDGIATIRVEGIISKSSSAFEKSCYGGVGPQDVTQSLDAAMTSDKVKGIILAVNSPGGTVAGVPEAGDRIAAAQEQDTKPIYTFTDQQMASAAYWLTAGSTRIYATRLASVGSIGVYMPWIDQSARAAMEGVRVTMIKDGKHKGAGYPGTSLTREQEDLLQAQVSQIGTDFRNHVTSYRGHIKRDDMEGQSFLGIDAAVKGFIDAVMPSIEDVKGRMMQALKLTPKTSP